MIKPELTSSKKNSLAAGIALLAILLFASCTPDEVSEGSKDDRPASLALTTLKATDIDIKETATRAATTTDYPTADSIGFFVKADASKGYVTCNNRKGKYSATRKQWLPVDTIWLNKQDADIAIYAPYDASHTAPATLNLTAALRPADGSKDIWCKHITANNTSKNLAVTLEHLYSRFYLTVKRDANYKADASLTTFALKGDDVYKSATYKPFETTPYTRSTTTGLTPAVTAQTLNASTASATYDLLLIPATLTNDLNLTLTIDGKKMEVKIDKTRFTGSKLEAGKQYNVNLALKPGKLEITSVFAVKWDVLPQINGGQVEFEKVTSIDIGLNFVIAPGNLTATKYAGDESGYEYAFADEQGYYSDDGLGGDYFNWNTLSPADYLANQTGEWNNAQDPCRLVSDGSWRTPTKDDLQKLIDKGNKWGTYTMKNGTTVSGSYFGTTSVVDVAEQDKYPFLPAAIYRGNGSPDIDVSGTYNDYWSSTPNGSSNAYCLNFNSSNCAINNFSRNYGFSVRCIKYKPAPAHAMEVGRDFYVADGNLRAISDGKGGYTYQFAESQGYTSSGANGTPYDPSGGDYFCWNTLDPVSVNAITATWDDTRDPCRKVGDGKWYTPTKEQMSALIGGGKRGTYTMPDGSTVNGHYLTATYGTTIDPSNQDNYVFMPSASHRNADTNTWELDRYNPGKLWTKTSEVDPYNGIQGYAYAIEGDMFGQYVITLTASSGTLGCSIRCVRDK